MIRASSIDRIVSFIAVKLRRFTLLVLTTTYFTII